MLFNILTRTRIDKLVVAILTLCFPVFSYTVPPEFSIYCTSNLDGTGRCKRVDNGEGINCIIVPGSVIACRDKDKLKYQCVQYGAVSANQTQFACVPGTSNTINDEEFEKTDQLDEGPSQSSKVEKSTPSPTFVNTDKFTGMSPQKNKMDNPFIDFPIFDNSPTTLNEREFKDAF